MPDPTREALANVLNNHEPLQRLTGGMICSCSEDDIQPDWPGHLADAVLSEFLVVPRRYLDREELRDVPFGTLMEREDGQVWQRVDALLAVRVWPDEGADGGPSGPVFPARVIWQPPQSSVGSPEEEGQG